MKVLIFLSIFALSQAQFPTASQKPWTGPLADHHIGIHPGDTSEVSDAKIQHLKAYQDVLATLPELPPDERYIMDDLPLPAVRASQQQPHQKPTYVQHIRPVIPTQTPHMQHVVEVQPNPVVPTVFAEEIPRSSIGEVPEVHAARLAHLKTFEKTRASLPSLTV